MIRTLSPYSICAQLNPATFVSPRPALASLRARLDILPMHQEKYDRYKLKHVKKKISIQIFSYYLIVSLAVLYRVGHYLLSGEDPRRAALSLFLLAMLSVLQRLKNKYPTVATFFG